MTPQSSVLEALLAAGAGCAVLAHGTAPQAYACAFSENLITYELAFVVDSFALTPEVRSDMVGRIATAFRDARIGIGPQAMDIRIMSKDVNGTGVPGQ